MSDTDYEARVLTLPVERTITAARRTAASAAARQVAPVGSWHVDDWGRDPEFTRLAERATALRWRTVVAGADRLPVRAGGLIVVNAWRPALTPLYSALVLTRQSGRPVRFVGRPDVAPVGALARRLGGLLARPDEVAGALRAGELLVMGAAPTMQPRRVGRVDHTLICAAVVTRAAVFPAAVACSPLGRAARIDIGPAVRPGRNRRGPLTELELADELEQRIRRLLQESGRNETASSLDRLARRGTGGEQ